MATFAAMTKEQDITARDLWNKKYEGRDGYRSFNSFRQRLHQLRMGWTESREGRKTVEYPAKLFRGVHWRTVGERTVLLTEKGVNRILELLPPGNLLPEKEPETTTETAELGT